MTTVGPRLRLGLMGAGRRGQAHASTVAGLPDLYQLVAIYDLDDARARAVAERWGGEAHTDLRAFFSRGKLDAVVIATPPDTHHLMAKAAADHGVPMLIETPLALTRAMMDFIAEAAEKEGICVEVGENYGRRPAERVNQLALEAGLIGEILHLSTFNAPANHDSCYHAISLLRLYADADVQEVRALAHPHDLGLTGAAETWMDAVLSFESGATASVNYVTSWTAPVRWGRPRITTVEGTAGYLVSGDAEGNRLHRLEDSSARDYPLQIESRREGERQIPTRFSYETSPTVDLLSPFADRALPDAEPTGVADGLARAAELAALHRAVTAGAPVECDISSARRSQEVGIAIIEAARLGRPLPATLGEETPWERRQHDAFRQRWGADPLRDVDLILRRA